MKRLSTLLLLCVALFAISCSGTNGGKITKPSLDERLFDFAGGGVKESISYRSDNPNATFKEAVIETNGGFNELKFTPNGAIALAGGINYHYDDDGDFTGADYLDTKVYVKRDENGRLRETSTKSESYETSFIHSYKYNDNGDAVYVESKYWESGGGYEYSYSGGECIASKFSFSPDYETTIYYTTIFEVVERDNRGNWIQKRCKSTIDETYSPDLGINPENTTHKISEEEFVLYRKISYHN